MPEIPCPLAEAAARAPEALALIGPEERYSCQELDRHVSKTAKSLRALGLRRGDILACALPPSADYVVILLGAIRLGAVACPMNPRLPRLNLLATLNHIRSGALVCSAGHFIARQSDGIRFLTPEKILKYGTEVKPRIERVSTDRPATIVFTSGTAARPKAALHSYGSHYHNARASNANLELAPGDRWLLSLPLYHVAGLGIVFRCLLAGATMVLPNAGEEIHESIMRYSVTHVSLVATQLYRLLQSDAGVAALAQLKAILLGGSAMPAGLLRTACERGLPIYISYGMTETASQVATSRASGLIDPERPSAKVLLPNSVRIARGGEIEVCGPTLFKGYLGGETLEEPFTPDGWFPTGDLGRLDADGRLIILGRKDNLFISGGENIQPEEIEMHLCRIAGVMQAVVVPIPDAEYGHRPVAFLQMAPGCTLNPDDLAGYLAQVLPRFKIPKTFFPWPELGAPASLPANSEAAGEGLKANRKQLARLAAERNQPQSEPQRQ